jgi:hypothetical protein
VDRILKELHELLQGTTGWYRAHYRILYRGYDAILRQPDLAVLISYRSISGLVKLAKQGRGYYRSWYERRWY